MSGKPGWYADPLESRRLKYWNGSSWSNRPPPPPAIQVSNQIQKQSAIQHNDNSDFVELRFKEKLRQEVQVLKEEYETLSRSITNLQEENMVQEMGFFKYFHPLDSSVECKEELKKFITEQLQ